MKTGLFKLEFNVKMLKKKLTQILSHHSVGHPFIRNRALATINTVKPDSSYSPLIHQIRQNSGNSPIATHSSFF